MVDYQAIPEEYRDDTYAYALLIVDRAIESCKKVYDACVRHLKDLLKIKRPVGNISTIQMKLEKQLTS